MIAYRFFFAHGGQEQEGTSMGNLAVFACGESRESANDKRAGGSGKIVINSKNCCCRGLRRNIRKGVI